MSKSELKRLKVQWNKKLKDSGFQDAEKANGQLRDFHSKSFSEITAEEQEEKRRYFSLAVELGYGYTDEWGNWIDVFEGKEKDRKVWLEHCKGLPETDISRSLKLHRNTVSRIINKYNKFIVRL